MSYRPDGTLQCDMKDECTETVTHIGDGGWIYCASHAPDRRQWERVRKLRPHELNRLKAGKQIAHY